jgi:hypothetical protein
VSNDRADRWVARAWMLLIASSALYFLADNEADNDLWIHVWSGRVILASRAVPRVDAFSYTAAGLPWTDHEWLTEVGFATVFDALGADGLWACKLVVALLTAGLVWLAVARRSRSPWVRGPIMLLVLAALARGYAIRPQIVSYLGIAALLDGLDALDDGAHPPPGTWLLIIATALGFAAWANAHAGFVAGIAIVALFALVPRWPESHQSSSNDVPGPVRVTLLAAALLGACLTPYGLSLFSYILVELRAPHPLTEWQPVRLDDPAHLPFLLLVALLLITLPFARMLWQRPWRFALVAGAAIIAARQQRQIPLFALVAAAPLTEQADAALGWLRRRSAFRLGSAAARIVAVGLCALAAAQLGLLSARVWRTRAGIFYAADEYPVGALAYARQHQLRGNLAVPLDWGGYALWHLAPAVKVSLDGRFATLYPARVVDDNFAFFRGDGGADSSRLLDAYDTDLALVPRGVRTPVDARPEWHLLYRDAVAALFARSAVSELSDGDAPRGLLPFP